MTLLQNRPVSDTQASKTDILLEIFQDNPIFKRGTIIAFLSYHYREIEDWLEEGYWFNTMNFAFGVHKF